MIESCEWRETVLVDGHRVTVTVEVMERQRDDAPECGAEKTIQGVQLPVRCNLDRGNA